MVSEDWGIEEVKPQPPSAAAESEPPVETPLVAARNHLQRCSGWSRAAACVNEFKRFKEGWVRGDRLSDSPLAGSCDGVQSHMAQPSASHIACMPHHIRGRATWRDVACVVSTHASACDHPCIVFGDFNLALHVGELLQGFCRAFA
eukprot:96287-Amphidinium_carterae.1